MDPLTHALLGATAAQFALGPRLGRHAWMIGAFGGVLPDADIVIGSASDPLLAIEYHRQFTHAFAFIPVGGAVAAAPWLLKQQLRPHWRPVLAAATIGYATHGLLDACTNYGTHLLWPFSDLRVAWHWITTIGPLLTLMLLVGLVFSVRRQSRWPAALALVLGLGYVGAAVWQRESALAVQSEIAASRGHRIDRPDMFPTVGNMLLWRSVYESDGRLYTDRIRVLGSQTAQWKPASSVALVRESDLSPEAQADARVRRDFDRFRYFSAGWVARATADPSVIGDARYSLSTEAYVPIWGVRFHPGAPLPTEWVDHTARNRVPVSALWQELSGTDPAYGPLPGR
ncbi:MAG: inner membrane protein [Pseudomonadota bacterium]|nr:inner membrane protein [Pseudomonadota bacterium]